MSHEQMRIANVRLPTCLINDYTKSNEDNSVDNNTIDDVFQECDNVSVEGLTYVIGDVVHKYRKLYPDPSVPREEITDNDWVKHLPEDRANRKLYS
ncbi:hypothetical protein PR048_033083 [Dryococelus australis]|uniref:Uncharacterized protein n=1 Tax=Dryococelus australis TaxID=614101 RepID=A0ABQ9G072_9NEOP|nr:hypothetical protein PR048_033083 [Dryococelus australis]